MFRKMHKWPLLIFLTKRVHVFVMDVQCLNKTSRNVPSLKKQKWPILKKNNTNGHLKKCTNGPR